jgi:hypothetical protein
VVKAFDVSHAPRSPNHVTKSPLCPASPIAERAFIDIVATRALSVGSLRMTSASVGIIILTALSPVPLDVP